MKLSALLAPLIAARVPHDQIMAVIVAFEAEQGDALERRRQADAERQARKRSRDVTLRHSDRSLTGASVTRVEDKTLTSEIEPQKEEKKESRSPAKPSPRQRLEAVLDADHADAVLEHRQRLRKPLTERAASLLAKDLAKFPDPNAAADRMIGKGWLTIEVEWAGAQQRAGPSVTSPPQMADVFKLIKENGNGRQEREDRSGTGTPVSYLPAARSG